MQDRRGGFSRGMKRMRDSLICRNHCEREWASAQRPRRRRHARGGPSTHVEVERVRGGVHDVCIVRGESVKGLRPQEEEAEGREG